MPDATLECLARIVLGHAAFYEGDHVEADRQFSRSDAFDEAHHVREPPNRYHADHAEAVISLGDLDRAEKLVSRLEERAKALPRLWILAISARTRGLLQSARGDQDGALASIQEAMKHHEHLDMSLENARTLLALGQVHRRRNE